MNIIPIIVVIFLSGVGALGDFFIKLSGGGSKYIMYQPFFIGMIIYALSAVGWFYVMKHIKLGSLGIFYSLTTVILLVIIGAVFFKEQLNTYDILGVMLGILSIILLGRFG
jgi:small multidrug resistance pump